MLKDDRFTVAVRNAFGRYRFHQQGRSLTLELIRAGIVPRDEGQTPYEAGPPIFPLHS